MSEFHVEVVRLGPVLPLENSDRLEITLVHGGYPCITESGRFKEGDLAVYVPVDSMVPLDHPDFAWLKKKPEQTHHRVKAMKLRGTFSMGLLAPIPLIWDSVQPGQDAAEALGITKYEPPETGSDQDVPDPGLMPVYTDIEGLRKYLDVLIPGEDVVITEKIHGENARYTWARDHEGGSLWVGSRTRFKQDNAGSRWWQAARAHMLAPILSKYEGFGFYGEVHGYTKGFKYGVSKSATGLRFYDVIDTVTRKYLDCDHAQFMVHEAELDYAPILYRGPWEPSLLSLAEGVSTLDASHVREGFVVRPVKERFDPRVGRVILKLHGEGFLLKVN